MERQLSAQCADLLTIAVGCDRYDAVCVAKLRRFQQRERRNTLARSQFKSVGNESIVLIASNLDLVGIRFTAVAEISFHVGFPDNSIQMSRSSNINLIVRDDGIELLLGFTETADIVKDNLILKPN